MAKNNKAKKFVLYQQNISQKVISRNNDDQFKKYKSKHFLLFIKPFEFKKRIFFL